MKLSLIQPDDWHCHLRDGAAMRSVAPATAAQFGRAVIMPNLKPPITTVAQAQTYHDQIRAALPENSAFQPLMTLYLTDNTTVADIEAAAKSDHVVAVKYYPAGATTNSDAGVTDLKRVYPILQAMQDNDLPLLIHGEVTDPEVDIFDREALFIEQVLQPLLSQFKELRVVLEHITTQQAAEFIQQGEDRLAATITVHHLLMNRNALFQGGMRPDHYCLPVLKRETHRLALLNAVSSDSSRFFLRTDTAPHSQTAKHSGCGCAGIYSAPVAMPLYAQVFEDMDALDKLEGFASFYGADFYRLPRHQHRITLQKQDWQVPDKLPLGDQHITPYYAGQTIHWQMVDN